LLEQLQAGYGVIQQHSVPGSKDIFVCCIWRQMFLYFLQEFFFVHFAGFQVFKQGIGMELGEMTVEIVYA
jgi:hypothetical protein